jgi:hypothetical protein
MRFILGLMVLVGVLSFGSFSWAQVRGDMPGYINGRPPLPNLLTIPPQSTDNLLITRGPFSYRLPGSYFVPFSLIPECDDIEGQHLNYSNGVFRCGVTGGTTGVTAMNCIIASGDSCLGINETDELLFR